MPRTKSDAADSIASFFENLASHLEHNNGVFMSDHMSPDEARRAQKELVALVNKYRDIAEDHRADGN
jgi:hypothetical protein